MYKHMIDIGDGPELGPKAFVAPIRMRDKP